jgi:hypothetical protein
MIPLQRNVFFPLDHDDQMLPVAECRTIPITDAIRQRDQEQQAARKSRITWTPRLSETKQKSKSAGQKAPPRPDDAAAKAHTPGRTPRKPAQTQPCKKCGSPAPIRKNKKGFCPTCKPERRKRRKHTIPYHDWRAHGLCIRCGDAPEAGKTQCKRCRERQSANSARYYQAKKKQEGKA